MEAPFVLTIDDLSVEAIVLVRGFGGANGTLVLSLDSIMTRKSELSERLRALGYYHSFLNPRAYVPYDREHYIDTLSDWRWCGEPSDVPAWCASS